MRIAVVGSGYVGLVSGACFSEMGAEVVCIDTDASKIEQLKNGRIPIYEPGLDAIVQKNMQSGRLSFETDLASCMDGIEIVFIAVGTPPDENDDADLRYVFEVARTFGSAVKEYALLVTKSTVPVGTSRRIQQVVRQELARRGAKVEFDVASNPEFLKEGSAIKDFMSPDRVVVGVESERAKELMSRLYRPFLLNNFRVIFMDVTSAEIDQIRREQHARHPHQLHERHRQPVRNRRSGREHGPQGNRQRRAHRKQVSLPGLRLRRFLLPERRQGADPNGREARLSDGGPLGGRAGQRAAETGAFRQADQAFRQRSDGAEDRLVGAGFQTRNGRYAGSHVAAR